MPFKSNKQRRYLWANEPRIAREWTNRYGARGGGIMRIPLANGSWNYNQEFSDLYKQGKYDNLQLAMEDANRYNAGETTNYENIIGKNPITDIYDRDYTAGEHYNMTPDDKIRAMRQDLKSVPNHMQRQTSFPTNKQTAPRSLGFDTSYGVANEADVAQEPLTQKKGNIFQRGWQGAKDFKTSIGEGIAGILDNTMIGKIAAMNNPFNRRAWNYQPGFRESVDAYQRQGMLGDVGRGPYTITQGPMAGRNMVSMFGSNNYRNMISKRLSKITARKHAGKTYSKNIEKKLKDEMRAETQRQRDLPSTAPGMGGQSYNQYVDRMVQDRSPERRGKPGGIGGKELMARGGIAGLWPR